MFQFHKVRLKARNSVRHSQDVTMFQFHKVRLKGTLEPNPLIPSSVSIP